MSKDTISRYKKKYLDRFLPPPIRERDEIREQKREHNKGIEGDNPAYDSDSTVHDLPLDRKKKGRKNLILP